MKILLLGADGFVGRQAALLLAARPEVAELVLSDYNIRETKKFAKALSPKCRWAMVDAGRAPDLERLLHDIDAVASAVGPCVEYEEGILSACARRKVPAATIGDAPMGEAARAALHDAFRSAGVPAVAGLGMMPGWTDLLATYRLAEDAGGKRDDGPLPFFRFSPDRFGGYTFFRRVARTREGKGAVPAGAPPGEYRMTAGGAFLGVPPGNPAAWFRRLEGTLGRMGPVGNEFFAAFLLWFRDRMKCGTGEPAAVAGVFLPGGDGGRVATVTDPTGRLAAATLAEWTLRLVAARGRNERGLLPAAELAGREEAEALASSVGATVSVARIVPGGPG
jgi:hypothetical protein